MLRVKIDGTLKETATIVEALQKWQVDNPEINIKLYICSDVDSEWLKKSEQ